MSTGARPDDWEDPVVIPEIARPRRALVPFDGSHNAERALAWSVLVAHNNGAEVIVVVAFEPPLTMRGRGAAYVEEARGALADEAQSLAEEAVALLLTQHVQARGIVVSGDPARAILDTVDDEDCDMVIIGKQGLTAELRGATGALARFRELAAGGVAEKVHRHATVPVLMVV